MPEKTVKDILDPELYASASSGTKRAGKGDLLNHLSGKKLYRSQAIKAKCYECNGMGEIDVCDIKACPLHPFSPYRDSSDDRE